MHRYSVDNAISFSADDLALFRESPFASWMERLTLENPDHGIPPDAGSTPPGSSSLPQHAFAAKLRASGRQFVQIDWDMEERKRRGATLEAMRSGANFIVDGHLAVGPLAGPVNLLMRTSGFSEWGDYLYLPCDTQGDASMHASFRLCFIADLLHSLQGQLPPQMLLIQRDSDLVALQTDDHIHYYRAVKQRFMLAQREFRKHRMPDPAESSHCGRWYDCANEVIRQRLLQRQEPRTDTLAGKAAEKAAGKAAEKTAEDSAGRPLETSGERSEEISSARPAANEQAEPLVSTRRWVASGRSDTALYDLDSVGQGGAATSEQRRTAGTLAEQASALDRGAGSKTSPAAAGPRLTPLRFIGESQRPPDLLGNLQRPANADASGSEATARSASRHGDDATRAAPAQGPHPLDSPGFNISGHVRRGPRRPPAAASENGRERSADSESPRQSAGRMPAPPFSDRLNTSDAFDS